MCKAKFNIFIIIFAVLTVITFSSCDDFLAWLFSDSYKDPSDFNQWVTRVEFSGTEQTVRLENLDGNDVFLVKVNLSDSIVSAGGTGSVRNISPVLDETVFAAPQALYTENIELPRMGRPHEEQFLFPLPVPVIDDASLKPLFNFIPPVVGNTRNFWVESEFNNNNFIQRQATLTATGNHSNIWVVSNSINTSQAQSLALAFDKIYPAATNIMGYEYGGKPGHSQPGGRDGDPKIQILVYDIGNNVAGYFWAKDFFPDSQLSGGQRSNNAEIFYMDSSVIKDHLSYSFSTLVHEFQHMVNFNVKFVENGRNSSAWYNEMLSLMAEDVLAELLDISVTHYSHITNQYIPSFLTGYSDEGISEWGGLNADYSYSNKYAFGAFLLRNYGGADLFKKILANDRVDITSVTEALGEISPGVTFYDAVMRFAEAMIFSKPVPPGIMTFNKTASNTINGTRYAVYGFDVWETTRRGTTQKGPLIYNLNQRSLRPHSMSIHTDNTWKNKSGYFSITLQRPTNSNVVFFLMVK